MLYDYDNIISYVVGLHFVEHSSCRR